MPGQQHLGRYRAKGRNVKVTLCKKMMTETEIFMSSRSAGTVCLNAGKRRAILPVQTRTMAISSKWPLSVFPSRQAENWQNDIARLSDVLERVGRSRRFRRHSKYNMLALGVLLGLYSAGKIDDRLYRTGYFLLPGFVIGRRTGQSSRSTTHAGTYRAKRASGSA